MRRTLAIINEAVAKHGPGYIAYSGGTDSTVLVDIVYRKTPHRPVLVYAAAHRIPRHPARNKGAVTIGCIWCGGGAQYTASCYRVLRETAPDLWWRFIVEMRGGEIILAVKHEARLTDIREAIDSLGGLAQVAKDRPWVFDFLRMPPRPNYAR